MSATLVALLVLTCTVGGALIGMWLRSALPPHHLDGDSRDVVRLAMGLVATMTALVLGLVIASAKSAFDAEDAAITQSTVDVLTLDRALARYGPETADIRKAIRIAVAAQLEATWPEDGTHKVVLDDAEVTHHLEGLVDRIRSLTPTTEAQSWLQSQALQLGSDMLETRWLVRDRATNSIPVPFLVILVSWLTLLFSSFGLFAPRHGTAVAVLSLCALSVAAAVFLILEMEHPFDGTIKVSSAPVIYALSQLDQ